MRTLLIFIFLFQITDSSAQSSMPAEEIDSLFESLNPSDSDWVISLSIDQAGTIPIYDSLGNRLLESPEGTFVLIKTSQGLFLQKLWNEYLGELLRSKVVFGKRIKIVNNHNINYTVDSVLLSDKEWIYPYVYKEKGIGAYNVQEPAEHEPYYGMYFKVMQKDGQRKFFRETSLSELEFFIPYKNLNYLYNSQTFIYRAFCKLLNLIKENMKLWSER